MSLFNDVRNMLSKGVAVSLLIGSIHLFHLHSCKDDKGFFALVGFTKLSLSDKLTEGKAALGCFSIPCMLKEMAYSNELISLNTHWGEMEANKKRTTGLE